MKKIPLYFLILFIQFGCKNSSLKKQVKDTSRTQIASPCIGFTGYDKLPLNDVKAQAAWLKLNGSQICKDVLMYRAFTGHKLNQVKYDSILNQYWQGRTPVITKFSWKEISNAINNNVYDNYLKFYSVGDTIKYELISDFVPNSTCYSAPLFMGIADSLVLSTSDTEKRFFEFSRAGIDGKKIIFKIDRNSYLFFDISDDPTNVVNPL